MLDWCFVFGQECPVGLWKGAGVSGCGSNGIDSECCGWVGVYGCRSNVVNCELENAPLDEGLPPHQEVGEGAIFGD